MLGAGRILRTSSATEDATSTLRRGRQARRRRADAVTPAGCCRDSTRLFPGISCSKPPHGSCANPATSVSPAGRPQDVQHAGVPPLRPRHRPAAGWRPPRPRRLRRRRGPARPRLGDRSRGGDRRRWKTEEARRPGGGTVPQRHRGVDGRNGSATAWPWSCPRRQGHRDLDRPSRSARAAGIETEPGGDQVESSRGRLWPSASHEPIDHVAARSDVTHLNHSACGATPIRVPRTKTTGGAAWRRTRSVSSTVLPGAGGRGGACEFVSAEERTPSRHQRHQQGASSFLLALARR